MDKNMGKVDRIIRSILAVILLALSIVMAFLDFPIIGIIFLVLALLMGITSSLGCCPMYVPFNISTLAMPVSPNPVGTVSDAAVEMQALAEEALVEEAEEAKEAKTEKKSENDQKE